MRVGISDTTVWRHHREVTRELATSLEREERQLPAWVSWHDAEAMEWIVPQDPIEDHASVSIDGLTILVRDEGYREVKMVSVSKVVTESGQEERSGPPEAGSKSREGPLASEGEGLRGRQDGLNLGDHSYRAILGDKRTFTSGLKGELARRRVRQANKITTVNDGADWIWDLAQAHLPDRRMEVLDWPHAIQNLAKAGNAAWREGSEEAQTWLAQRATELWNGQILDVQIALNRLPRRYKERGRAIRQVKDYITQHRRRLHYDHFRADGRPIGSGTVESAAKNVVGWRMKRGGQRWSRLAATRMLAALGEVHSGRWNTRYQPFARAA